MGMGNFTRDKQYRQQNAMDNAGALMGLLKLQSNQQNKAVNAVDEYGQSRVRGSVSDLMGTKEYTDANPAEAQALISALTGGRDLGENFAKTIKMSDDNKGNVQGNTWKEDAAKTLFGRQMSKQAQSHANSVALSKMNNKARQKLYGETTTDNPMTSELYTGLKNDRRQYQSIMDTKNADPRLKEDAQMKIDEIDYKLNTSFGKPTSDQKEFLGGKGRGANSATPVVQGGRAWKNVTNAVKQQSSDYQKQAYEAGLTQWDGDAWRFSNGELASDANILSRYPQ